MCFVLISPSFAMATLDNKQHLLTNGYIDFESKPFPRFLVYNHKPQVDKPLFMNKRDMDKLLAYGPQWQAELKNVQAALSAGKIPSERGPHNLVVFGRNCIRLCVQTYNEKAYLWLKLYYLKDDKWLPAKGGLIISEADNFNELKKFVQSCL